MRVCCSLAATAASFICSGVRRDVCGPARFSYKSAEAQCVQRKRGIILQRGLPAYIGEEAHRKRKRHVTCRESSAWNHAVPADIMLWRVEIAALKNPLVGRCFAALNEGVSHLRIGHCVDQWLLRAFWQLVHAPANTGAVHAWQAS